MMAGGSNVGANVVGSKEGSNVVGADVSSNEDSNVGDDVGLKEGAIKSRSEWRLD